MSKEARRSFSQEFKLKSIERPTAKPVSIGFKNDNGALSTILRNPDSPTSPHQSEPYTSTSSRCNQPPSAT